MFYSTSKMKSILLCFVLPLFDFPIQGNALKNTGYLDDKTCVENCKCKRTASPEIYVERKSDTQHEIINIKLICENGTSVDTINKGTKLLNESNIYIDLETSDFIQDSFNHTLHSFVRIRKLKIYNAGLNIKPGSFKDLQSLEDLDLSSNQFIAISADTLNALTNLKKLSFANNKIESIEPKAFFHLKSLLYLSLANNKLYSLEENVFNHLINLKEMDLSKNSLSSFSDSTFSSLKNLKILSLAMNDLKTLSVNLFSNNETLEKVNLAGNPWVCDQKLLQLKDWVKKYHGDKENAICMEPPELRNRSLHQGLEILYLESNILKNPTCNITMCNCTVSKDQVVVTVDCRGRHLTKLPETLPFKTRRLDMSDNHLRSLTVDHIVSTDWSYLSFLHLNNNFIDSLKGLEGTWLLRNLVALHLTNNQLAEIPIHILEQFSAGMKLDELYLSGNPWNCDCNTVGFKIWLQDNYKNIRDFYDIRCSAESGIYANQRIESLLKSELCPQYIQLVNYLDVFNSLIGICIVIIIFKLSYDYWFQKRTGKLPHFFSLNLR